MGQKTKLTLTTPDGQSQTVDYTYDDAGNLSTVAANQKTFTYHYDDTNRKIERDDPNGVVTKYAYDVNGRLKGYVTTQGDAANAPILAKDDYTSTRPGSGLHWPTRHRTDKRETSATPMTVPAD